MTLALSTPRGREGTESRILWPTLIMEQLHVTHALKQERADSKNGTQWRDTFAGIATAENDLLVPSTVSVVRQRALKERLAISVGGRTLIEWIVG